MPSRLPPRDCVDVALRDRLGHGAMRGPEKRDQSGSLHGPRRLRAATSTYGTRSPVALSYVASSLAEPRPRIRESASLRSFAEQRYLARCVAPRDLGLNRVATVS